VKLTKAQLEWLQWLQENGGSAYLERQWVIANGHKSRFGSAISFLGLVVKGAIEAKNERLVLTDYGRKLLTP
jgi:hypothetical protein